MMISIRKIYPITTFSLLMTFEYIISLKLLELRVPAYLVLGTRADLSCRWQMNPTDILYSVKWYKDGEEFFRHIPLDHEPQRQYSLPGVDVERSDEVGSNLTLGPVELATSGRYRCEISGERPIFRTVSEHADLTVIALPSHGPVISGFRSCYRIGDCVYVNCVSGQSYPVTHLVWYINGEPTTSNTVLSLHHKMHNEHLVTTKLALNFNVTEEHFKNNELKIKCLATISPVYWRSNEESAHKERNKRINDRFTEDLLQTKNIDVSIHNIGLVSKKSNLASMVKTSSSNFLVVLFVIYKLI